MAAPKRVFVLLYNARTENEGIHTIRIDDRNTVLMFESEDDATRYGMMLEAQDFPTPTVEAIDPGEIEAFCEKAGYGFQLISEGMLELPPENNLEETEWQPDAEETKEPELSDLERIRRQLEGLL